MLKELAIPLIERMGPGWDDNGNPLPDVPYHLPAMPIPENALKVRTEGAFYIVTFDDGLPAQAGEGDANAVE